MDFEAPEELQKYGEVERIGGISDNPFDIAMDKARREEFNLGRIIVEGRGGEDNTWRTIVSQLLRQDLSTAVRFLKELLEY